MCDPAQSVQHPRLIIGLGNPGARYRNNRHNLGFKVVEALAGKLSRAFAEEHDSYLATPANLDPVLLKPLTYMNLSGHAVVSWLERHHTSEQLDPGRILVVCDDLALPLGSLRLRGKGSSGGQNGLASVIAELETDRFPRLRLGIDGTEGQLLPERWPDYVLADFDPDEQDTAERLIAAAVAALKCWLEQGLETAASRHNGTVVSDPEE